MHQTASTTIQEQFRTSHHRGIAQWKLPQNRLIAPRHLMVNISPLRLTPLPELMLPPNRFNPHYWWHQTV